jgi:hypothetical protein
VVANLQYSGIVFRARSTACCCSATASTLAGWGGMALIVASGIAATVLRNGRCPRRRPRNTEPFPVSPRSATAD